MNKKKLFIKQKIKISNKEAVMQNQIRKRITSMVVLVCILFSSIVSGQSINCYGTDQNNEYTWYSSIESAVLDANNLTTVNADCNQVDAEVGLCINGDTAIIKLQKNTEATQTIHLNVNTILCLEGNSLNMASGQGIEFCNDLEIQNGSINFSEVNVAIKGNILEEGNENGSFVMNNVNTVHKCSSEIGDIYTINLDSSLINISNCNINSEQLSELSGKVTAIYVNNESAVVDLKNNNIETSGYSVNNISVKSNLLKLQGNVLNVERAQYGHNLRASSGIVKILSGKMFCKTSYSGSNISSSAENVVIDNCECICDGMSGKGSWCFGMTFWGEADIVINNANVISKAKNYSAALQVESLKTNVEINGGYYYSNPIDMGDTNSNGTGILNSGKIRITEKENPVTVIGGNAAITCDRGSTTVIDGGTFKSPSHGGAYICCGDTGYCEINGGRFENNRVDYTKEELGTIVSCGGMYVGSGSKSEDWGVDIRNATIVGGTYGLVQKSNHGYIPATINLYDCTVSGTSYDIFVQNNQSVGTYNAYVNIYDGTRLVHDIIYDAYELNYGESHVIDYRNQEHILKIRMQPQDITVSLGQKVSIPVIATGKGLKYQWELSKDGGKTWNKSAVDGYNTSTIIFNAIESFHGRKYRCVVTDENGDSIISDSATIFISELENKVVIISQPQNKTVPMGGRTSISVSAIGPGLKYQWELSKDGGLTWSKSKVDGYNTSTIIFNVIESFHGRMYRCVVTDENGNSVTSQGAMIFINELLEKPVIVTQPPNRKVSLGSQTTIPIKAIGKGLKYQWELSKDDGLTWSKSKVDGYNTSTIIFAAIESFDGRMYRCVVTDENGNSVTSNAALITIE